MIRAVLFDLDGVVRHFDDDADLERRHGLDDGDIARVAFASPLIEEVTTGRITRAEWIARIAERTAPAAAEEWGRTPFRLDPEVLAVIDALRATGIRCMILTNGTDTIPRELRDSGLDAHLDGIVNSAEIGYAKPDPRAFQHALDALELRAEEVFFTDDSPSKLTGADELGITTHHFTGVLPLRRALLDAQIALPALDESR